MRYYSIVGLSTLIAFVFCMGCGGGSSGSDVVVEGTLTQSGGTDHRTFRHSDGQRIGEVRICAFSKCSVTDNEGQWGFELPTEFDAGEVLFTVQGHGIDGSFVVEIPASARDVFLDVRHEGESVISVAHITIDGETEHHEEHVE